MQQHEPRESQFHTFHSREEKLQPERRAFHLLNLILAVFSLLFAIFLSLNVPWHPVFIFLALVDILIVNVAFFYFINIGRRIENRKKELFFSVAFISALILVYFASTANPEGINFFLGMWIVTVLLNTGIYRYCMMK